MQALERSLLIPVEWSVKVKHINLKCIENLIPLFNELTRFGSGGHFWGHSSYWPQVQSSPLHFEVVMKHANYFQMLTMLNCCSTVPKYFFHQIRIDLVLSKSLQKLIVAMKWFSQFCEESFQDTRRSVPHHRSPLLAPSLHTQTFYM